MARTNSKRPVDDLQLLVTTLPAALQEALQRRAGEELLEVVLDLGRPPEARLSRGAVRLADDPVRHEDIHHVVALVGAFGPDNRAGIEGTLHRISAIRNRKGDIVGLTLRVGRAVSGTIDLIRDMVESAKSVLLLGRPGVGKTTKLREIARILADEFSKRVIVIDTSNEIAGDGDIPHPAIGGARRMQVSHPDRQHAVMIEAVENHMPQVIVIDEIGTLQEAVAARTIAERGVQLIGTAHGNTLENLVMNPTLSDLVGGVQTVTLSDEEARVRGTQKTVNERKSPPTFDVVVEIMERNEVAVHKDTALAVDDLLRGLVPRGEQRGAAGVVSLRPPGPTGVSIREERPAPRARRGPMRIYPYAISRDLVDRVIRDLRLDAYTARRPEDADHIVALRARAEDSRLRRLAETVRIPLHFVKKNSTAQIRHTLQNVFNIVHGVEEDDIDQAVREAEEAIKHVIEAQAVVELEPRPSALRKMQHRIVARHQLNSESIGSGAQRHLVIYPD